MQVARDPSRLIIVGASVGALVIFCSSGGRVSWRGCVLTGFDSAYVVAQRKMRQQRLDQRGGSAHTGPVVT